MLSMESVLILIDIRFFLVMQAILTWSPMAPSLALLLFEIKTHSCRPKQKKKK